MAMQENDVSERLHGLETAQAVQTAVQSGSEATQAAMQAGAASTNAAAHAGTIAMVVTGSVALIVGLFLGITIRASK
jgi:CHASE3 domain sensor protein